MSYKRGSAIKALDYCEQAIKQMDSIKTTRPDLIICLKGFILNETGDSQSTRMVFDSFKKKFPKLEDSYMRLYIAKMDYDASTLLRDKPEE